MKTIFISILLLLSYFSFGQTAIKKSNVSSGGGSQTNASTTVIYTIGEIAVQENINGNIHLSEGFIGPDIITVLGIENYTELQDISVYPNPVNDLLNIQLPENKNYEIHLFDLSGKELLFLQNDENKQQLNLSDLPSSVYVLLVIDRKNNQSKMIKIQKL